MSGSQNVEILESRSHLSGPYKVDTFFRDYLIDAGTHLAWNFDVSWRSIDLQRSFMRWDNHNALLRIRNLDTLPFLLHERPRWASLGSLLCDHYRLARIWYSPWRIIARQHLLPRCCTGAVCQADISCIRWLTIMLVNVYRFLLWAQESGSLMTRVSNWILACRDKTT